MGNRGELHNAKREVVVPWRGKRWITCLLEFRGRRREVFAPGRYSELFFLDEATAYAAGHRPCAECRRQDFNRFRQAWAAANQGAPSAAGSVDRIDDVLHSERTLPGGGKRTYEASLHDLPCGTFVEVGDRAYLVTSRGLRLWSFERYGPAKHPVSERVRVLTPASIVRLFRAGLEPQVHGAALAG